MNTIKLIFLSALLSLVFVTNAQDKLYESQLETVYLKNSKEVIYTNTFNDFNQHMILLEKINFRKEIKLLKGKNNSLSFISNKRKVSVPSSSYLKIIRKGANRSKNVQAFQIFLTDKFPYLGINLSEDKHLKELYFISRKDTFNGKIDALPSVL